jgi:hypothetical protein
MEVQLNKFLRGLGALTLAVLVAGAVSLAVLVYKGRALDAESKAFVDNAVPAIASNWGKEQLLDRATPELRNSVGPGQLTTFFNTLSRLGPLLKYEGAAGASAFSYIAGAGNTESAAYTAKARFQNGSATFQIVLLKRGGRWMIQTFHVDPKLDGEGSQRT